MKNKRIDNDIDTLEFEISHQEMEGKSGAGGWYTTRQAEHAFEQ